MNGITAEKAIFDTCRGCCKTSVLQQQPLKNAVLQPMGRKTARACAKVTDFCNRLCILINLFNKKIDPRVFWERFRKTKKYISVITKIEIFSYSKLSPDDEEAIKYFLKEFRRIPLSVTVQKETIRVRRTLAQKLPDSIIAATAVIHKAKLISKDGHFTKALYPGLAVEYFE
jgi:predicted nucleic acid-binding protein